MRRSFVVLVVVGLLSCGPAAAVPEPSSSPTPRTYPAGSSSPSPAPAVPVRLRIPALRIDSPVMVVGLMPDGSVGTPCDPAKPSARCDVNATAWYKGSARPGAPGSAVIDGHVDWYGPAGSNHDVPAVFAHLDRLRRGDLVEVLDATGATRRFVVDRVSLLPYPEQPAGTYATEGPSSVTLITCAGVYVDRRTGGSKRLYVHALLQK